MAIAINGMGRIGRLVLRDALGGVARHKSDVHKVAGPDIAPDIAPDIVPESRCWQSCRRQS